MNCVSVLISASQPAADSLVQAARVHLQLQGQAADGAAIVDTLSEAMALAIFSTVPDPGNKPVVREIMAEVSKQVRDTIKGMVRKAEEMALRDLTGRAEREYRP